MTRILLVIVGVMVAVACGSSDETSSVPSIEFDVDTRGLVPPKDTQGQDDADLSEQDGSKDTGTQDILEDTVEIEDLRTPDSDSIDLAADIPDADDLTSICEPGEVSCQSGAVVVCNPDGTELQQVDDCDDDNECTDDWCFEGACTHEVNNPNCCHPSCDIGEMCVNGECVCAPLCLGKDCGPDGCGGTCGECDEGWECSGQGICQCIPVCEGKECGDDSCGGSCGECENQHDCVDGECICVPDCEGKNCGSDGCGGSCGTCDAPLECNAGTCDFVCSGCPQLEECTRVLFNNHAYYICSAQKRWGKAEDYCRDHGTQFVTVNSSEENAFLQSQISDSHWIGLWQNWLGQWKWSDEQEADFTAWGDGQPDDGDFWTEEDCTELNQWGTWNDNQCNEESPFICEFAP